MHFGFPTMLSKNEHKFVRSLSVPKFRKAHQAFVAEGSTVIREFLDEGWKAKAIYALKNTDLDGATFQEINAKELSQLSELKHPHDAVAVFEMRMARLPEKPKEGTYWLACDRVQDPGNMGTIIRIADWFGVPYILCSEGCADVYNPKVVQSTMGSLARVKVVTTDLEQLLKSLNVPVLAAVLDGINLYQAEIPKTGIILLGNESKGISEMLLKSSSHRLRIPGGGQAESLNVSVAAGIVCAEVLGRRR